MYAGRSRRGCRYRESGLSLTSQVLFYLAPKLTLLMLTIMPPVGVGAVVYGKRKTHWNLTENRKIHETVCQENSRCSGESDWSGLRKTGQHQNCQSIWHGKNRKEFLCKWDFNEISLIFAEKVEEVYELGRKVAMANAAFWSGVHLAGNLSLLAVLAYGGSLVQSQVMTVGDLTSFLMYR